MNCPDIETIIRFIEQPPMEKDAQLAAHIFNCSDCRETFNTGLEAVHCSCQLTQADFRQAHEVVSKAVNKKDELKEIIAWFVEKLETGRPLLLLTEKIPLLSSRPAPLFASSGKRTKLAVTQGPEICFAADVVRTSPLYWRLKLCFPMVLTESGSLNMTLMDGDDRPIPAGTLSFRGINVDVRNGQAVLSVKDFKESMKGSGLHFTFPDHSVSNGGIVLR